MYDSVNFVLKKAAIPDVDLLAFVPQFLTKHTCVKKSEQGISINGYLDNLHVKISQNCLKVYESSICKYYLGDNFQTMTRQDTKQAIEKISDSLHVPFHKANVHRIDVSTHFIMKYPEAVYYSLLGNLQYYKRSDMNNGLYYFTKGDIRTLLFYGKAYEQKVKKNHIPLVYKDVNLLRYELRFLQKLSKQFNRAYITARLLYDEYFYIDIVDKWKDNYMNIDKLKKMNWDKEIVNDIKSFKEFMYLDNLRLKFSNQVEAENQIQTFDKMGFFGNRTQKKRLRDEIKRAYNLPELTFDSEIIKELDKKVIESAQNCK